MKFRIPMSLFFVFAIVLPVLAQTPAHESTIDGKWEATMTTEGVVQLTQFEFKNAGGEISGTVTEGKAQPMAIKNGRLDGSTLTFGTMRTPSGGSDPILMSWTGTIIGAGESIKLVRTEGDSPSGSHELEAKRIP